MNGGMIKFNVVLICTVLLFPFYAFAVNQPPEKIITPVTDEENSIIEAEIIDFLTAFSETYQKGDVDRYLSFFSPDVIENGINPLDKIKTNYVNELNEKTITSYEFDIYEIKTLEYYSLIDVAYSKIFVWKSNGEKNNFSGDIRVKVVKGTDYKIEAIDYDRHIKNEYVIGPEDVLEISVWKSGDLSTSIIVRPDGMISLPLIGEIKAKGRTALEIKEIIEHKLAEYKQDPVVSVIVREANSHPIYVMGEVIKPGKYLIRSEMRILQAIALAGGFTAGANRDNIIILRKTLMHPEGKRIRVKYTDIISGINPEENIIIRSGDTILLQPY